MFIRAGAMFLKLSNLQEDFRRSTFLARFLTVAISFLRIVSVQSDVDVFFKQIADKNSVVWLGGTFGFFDFLHLVRMQGSKQTNENGHFWAQMSRIFIWGGDSHWRPCTVPLCGTTYERYRYLYPAVTPTNTFESIRKTRILLAVFTFETSSDQHKHNKD